MGIESDDRDKDDNGKEVIDLSPRQREVVLDLLQTHLPGVAVWAYGSRVKGNARKYSDLDLVAFTNKRQDVQLNELRHALEESDLPFHVDLFAWREIPQSFRTQIIREYAVVQNGNAREAEPDG